MLLCFPVHLSFSPHFFYQDNYPYFMMSTHFSFSFILYFVLCWYLLCKLFIIVPPLVHLSQPNHNQHHTTYVCRGCIIRLLPPFPGGIQLLTNYMIAKKEQKQKKNTALSVIWFRKPQQFNTLTWNIFCIFCISFLN